MQARASGAYTTGPLDRRDHGIAREQARLLVLRRFFRRISLDEYDGEDPGSGSVSLLRQVGTGRKRKAARNARLAADCARLWMSSTRRSLPIST